MITQHDVHSLIQEEIPNLSVHVYPARVSLETHAYINYFTDYTMHAVEEHDFATAKKCFVLAENLYVNGDRMVRFLVENIFVYSFSLHKSHNRTEDFIVKSIIPKTLYTIYRKQLMQIGN